MNRQATSENPEIRLLQEKGDCVACGRFPFGGSVGEEDETEWLPCCVECYEGDKLEKWVQEHNHKFRKV